MTDELEGILQRTRDFFDAEGIEWEVTRVGTVVGVGPVDPESLTDDQRQRFIQELRGN